jgi:hypothetical protein
MSPQNAKKLLQKAGQAVHSASEALSLATKVYADLVAKAMQESPFDARADVAFDTWKATALMTQEASDLDLRLRKVYAQATESDNRQSMVALPLLVADTQGATDIQIKEVKDKPITRKKTSTTAGPKSKSTPTPSSLARAKPSSAAKSANPSKPAIASAPRVKGATPLPSNSVKLLAALDTLLNEETFEVLSQTKAAAAAGIPMGSVTASLGRLKEEELLAEEPRGSYRLTPKPKA